MYLIFYNITWTFAVFKLLVHTQLLVGLGFWVVFFFFFVTLKPQGIPVQISNLNVIGINLKATQEPCGSVFTKLHAIVLFLFKKIYN